LLTFFSADNPEFEELAEASRKVEEVVDYINNRKAIFENEQKMKEIKASVEGWGSLELGTVFRFSRTIRVCSDRLF
jgi:hypothetical protein